MSTDLLGQVRRGAAWQFASIAFSRFGQLALGIVIARLVSPNDFGIFAVALVVQAVVMSINELGVGEALVRGGEDSRAIATVTTLSIISSGVLAVVMYLLSGTFARLMNTPDATSTLQVLSMTVAMAGFTAAPICLLRRDFRQDKFLISDASGQVVGAITVISLALMNYGPLSLAWSRVAGQAVSAVLVIAFSPEPYRIGIDRSQVGRLLRFGLPLALAGGLSWIVVNADYVVISRSMGAVALGFYLLAFNVSGWPLNVFGAVVRAVALPAFGRLRHDLTAMNDAAVAAASAVATITFPVCFLLGALADPLIRLLYGDRWAMSIGSLVALSLFPAVRSLMDLFTGFLVALDGTRPVLVVQILWLTLLVPALIVGSHVAGLVGVGAAQSLVSLLVILPAYAMVSARMGLRPRPLFAACVPGLAASVLAAGCALATTRLFTSPLIGLLFGGLVGTAVYALIMGNRIRGLVSLARSGSPQLAEAAALEQTGAKFDAEELRQW
jgi:PST family polysaccharide transporter